MNLDAKISALLQLTLLEGEDEARADAVARRCMRLIYPLPAALQKRAIALILDRINTVRKEALGGRQDLSRWFSTQEGRQA